MASRTSTLSAALHRMLPILAFAAMSLPALAQPPVPGSTHTFLDPIFNGTVICDTIDAVRAIATAKAPDEIYANYYLTTNAQDEPICMAIVPTGTVLDVVLVGVMVKGEHHFDAWAVETLVEGVKVFALYLERREYVGA